LLAFVAFLLDVHVLAMFDLLIVAYVLALPFLPFFSTFVCQAHSQLDA
jgi:hypothetical protein